MHIQKTCRTKIGDKTHCLKVGLEYGVVCNGSVSACSILDDSAKTKKMLLSDITSFFVELFFPFLYNYEYSLHNFEIPQC